MHIEFQWFSFFIHSAFPPYDRKTGPCAPATAGGADRPVSFLSLNFYLLIFIQFQHAHKGFLRNLHVSYLAHPLLTFLLLLQQLLLSGNIAAVALGEDVFAHRADGFSGDNLRSDSRLDRDFEELPRNLFFELLAHLSSALVGRSLEYDEGQRIHFFFIDEDIEFYKLASLIAEQLVVE